MSSMLFWLGEQHKLVSLSSRQLKFLFWIINTQFSWKLKGGRSCLYPITKMDLQDWLSKLYEINIQACGRETSKSDDRILVCHTRMRFLLQRISSQRLPGSDGLWLTSYSEGIYNSFIYLMDFNAGDFLLFLPLSRMLWEIDSMKSTVDWHSYLFYVKIIVCIKLKKKVNVQNPKAPLHISTPRCCSLSFKKAKRGRRYIPILASQLMWKVNCANKRTMFNRME